MAKPWDDTIKRLIALNPAAFLHLFLPDAQFIEALPTKLQQEESEMDSLFLTEVKRDFMLVNFEVQARYDSEMPERLLRYNIITSMQRKLPVTSSVLHLLDDTPISPSPATWEVAGKEETHSFPYHVIELSQYTPEEIIKLSEVALLPLLPFTKGGRSREEIIRMFRLIEQDTTVSEETKQALASIGFTFASLIFERKHSSELAWLIERFHRMYETIDTPIFREIRRMAHEEGIEEGIGKGIGLGIEKGIGLGVEKGRLETARSWLVHLVEVRFKQITPVVQQRVERVTDPEVLEDLMVRISAAQNIEEAEQAISQWDSNRSSEE